MLKPNSLAGRYLGDSSFYREVAIVAMPIILQQLIATGMGFVDSVMVGQINAQAMASVTVSNKVFIILQSMLFGVTGGICIFISQYFGASDHDKGQGLFVLNLLGSLGVSSFFFILISLAPRLILSIFVSEQATIDDGQAYLWYIRFSYLPYAVSLACLTSLRAIGQTSKPLLIGSFAILLNTGLNFLLIFGNLGFPALGIGGAGLATLIARCCEMLLYLVLLAGNQQYFNLKLAPVRQLSREILIQVTRKTIPLTSNEMLWSIGMATLFWTYCQVNETYIASLTIVEMTGNIVFVVFGGLSAAVSVMVGARLGAGRFDEARRNARWLFTLNSLVSFANTLVILLVADLIPRLFNVAPEIRLLASQLMRIQAVFYVVIASNVLIFFILRIGGDMRATLIMDSVFIWSFVIPLAAALSLLIRPDMTIFYLIIQVTEMVKFIIAWHYYRKGRWVCNLT